MPADELEFFLKKVRQSHGGMRRPSSLIDLVVFEQRTEFALLSSEPGLLFLLSGELEYQIGEDEYRTLQSGGYLFYPKGVQITVESDQGYCGLLFELKREFIEQFLQMLRTYCDVPLRPEETAHRVCILQERWEPQVERALVRVLRAYAEAPKDSDYFINLALCELMYHIFPDEHMLSKIAYIVDTPTHPEPIRRVEQFLVEHYHQAVRIKQLVDVAMLSESHLNRLYKKHFDMSPMERLTAIRMEQAALLLRDSSLTVTHVAVQVGYQSMSAFIQQFKKKFGVSPKEYQGRYAGRVT